MKKKIYKALLLSILISCMPLSVSATGSNDTLLENTVETDIEIKEGEDVTIQSGVQSENDMDVDIENETVSNAPTSGSQGADAALNNVRSLRRSASDLLNRWRSSIRNSRRLSDSQLVKAIQNGNSLIVIGNMTFNMDEFEDGVLGPASMLWTIVHDSENNLTNVARNAAQTGSAGASPRGARYPGWNNLSSELQQSAMTSIMTEEGLAPSEETFINVYYPDELAGRIRLRNGMITDNIFRYNPSFRRLGMGGYRADLVADGLRDTPYWYNRYSAYAHRPNSSSAAEDYINITYLQEYRITNVITTDITEIDYENCERVWTVENLETGEIAEFERHTEDLTFTISGLSAGEYKVTPSIKTNMTTGSTVSYRVYEYMYETSTHNLLYYNETGTETIFLGGATTALGYVPTGEVFYIHVNALGEVEQDSNYIQMIE